MSKREEVARLIEELIALDIRPEKIASELDICTATLQRYRKQKVKNIRAGRVRALKYMLDNIGGGR